jgi:hypothetical protein
MRWVGLCVETEERDAAPQRGPCSHHGSAAVSMLLSMHPDAEPREASRARLGEHDAEVAVGKDDRRGDI